MEATSIDRASIEAIPTPRGFLHRSEGAGRGERGKVCAMDVW
jgi:hypothetical protein